MKRGEKPWARSRAKYAIAAACVAAILAVATYYGRSTIATPRQAAIGDDRPDVGSSRDGDRPRDRDLRLQHAVEGVGHRDAPLNDSDAIAIDERHEVADLGGRDFCRYCDETLRGSRNRDYRGTQTKSRSGKTCQNWDQLPSHKRPNRKPEMGSSGNNFCRNPDNSDTIWCYLAETNGNTWEYCDPIPQDETLRG